MIFFAVIATTIFAYLQTERKKFLIANMSAIFFISISFLLKSAYVGFLIEIGMFIVHFVAIFTTEDTEKKLKLIIPPIAFIMVLFANENPSNSIFMALAVSLFVAGVFQKSMIHNKLFFIVGLIFLCIYSLLNGATEVAISNIIGIGVLGAKALELRNSVKLQNVKINK